MIGISARAFISFSKLWGRRIFEGGRLFERGALTLLLQLYIKFAVQHAETLLYFTIYKHFLHTNNKAITNKLSIAYLSMYNILLVKQIKPASQALNFLQIFKYGPRYKLVLRASPFHWHFFSFACFATLQVLFANAWPCGSASSLLFIFDWLL